MKKLLTKRMINLHNTSDEYHTANEDSFTTTSFSGSSPNRSISIGQQQTIAGVTSTTTSGTGPPTTLAARKQLSPADPNEPAKPLSAYALFFRDTVSAIKQQNPTCSFQELSKIVASMWEALDPQHKTDYNKKHELAKNDYIKQMRIYRQQQAQTPADGVTTTTATTATNNNVTTLQQQQIPQTKPAVFTMNVNQQSNNQTQPQIAQRIVNNNAASPNSISTTIPSGGGEQVHMVNETETIQKCTRENCNKRAIINPDWEDEYCSNECVVIHCRNVFNAWVQSNLEAKQQQPSSDIQQTQGATT